MTLLKYINCQELKPDDADDVQLLFGGTPNNLKQLKAHAETSLKTMKDWCSKNGLKMNPNKTQCILFATPKLNKRTETFH